MDAGHAGSLFGWRKEKNGGHAIPNCADRDNDQSIKISVAILSHFNIPANQTGPSNAGISLEHHVREGLAKHLNTIAPATPWLVERGRKIEDFRQYHHLKTVDELVKKSPALRIAIGVDYRVKPDVTVAIPSQTPTEPYFLHAAISCKWTIRSDRVQNVRHEFNQMTRQRRGRQPHLVAVTAEPLPSRLVAIARGTGEVDAVYHVAFEAMKSAVESEGNNDQKNAWSECVEQGRVLPYEELPETLTRW
ncbi:NgoMIV family type II restriction endonuclease [Streptomyces otsuchiensis]|uniref:NgoMIV family type II restriction endonuclease n=1 Tax=Streptomyces otsuchiensis TaxID=2681388 RepID=UPI0010324C3A|nr:NgoMIV family type II restriction endonuclease [Streptomyces otsuchiensis]